jgi:zinc transport system substrate-binding protein
MITKYTAPLILICLLLIPGLARATTTVFVSIPPQVYFVERIAGDLVDTHVLVAPGASPHTYEPTPKQMIALSKAAAYFAIGVEFEKAWLPRIKSTNKSLHIVQTHKEVGKIPMVAHGDHGEKNEEHNEKGHADHNHDQNSLDPHIWLSTTNARLIAEFTCRGLIQIDSANTSTYTANLITLLNDIDRLDKDIRQGFKQLPKSKRTFMVFHPSWGYFAKDFKLTQIPIEAEGNEPSPRALAEIIHHGREIGISTIFVQPQFSSKSAKVIAGELNANVVALDPLARDWEQNMRRAAMAIQQATK